MRTSAGVLFSKFQRWQIWLTDCFTSDFNCNCSWQLFLIDFPPWWTLATDIRKKINMSEFNAVSLKPARKQIDKPITNQPNLLPVIKLLYFFHPQVNIIYAKFDVWVRFFLPCTGSWRVLPDFLLFTPTPPLKSAVMNCTSSAVGGAVYQCMVVSVSPRFPFGEGKASGILLVKLDLSVQLLWSKSEKQISQFLTLNGRSAIL